jgi:rRNA biogenesis protein RRP5
MTCFFQVLEEHCCENPFSNLRIGQKIQARIVAEHSGKSGRNLKWELSVKPSVLKGMLYQNLSVCPFHVYATASF